MTRYEDVDDATWIERDMHGIAATWESVAGAMGGRTDRWDGVRLADAASENSVLNAAILTRPLNEVDAGDLASRLEAYFAERPDGGPCMLWSVWPTPDLAQFGYVLRAQPTIMVRLPGGEAPPAPPELRIVEASSPIDLLAIERTFVESWPNLCGTSQLPGALFPSALLGGPFRFWAGYVGDDIVSVAAAHVSEDLIHVSFVTTQPHARQRGYGAALTWRATLANPALPAILEASKSGRSTYERIGYREIGLLRVWQRPREPVRPYPSEVFHV